MLLLYTNQWCFQATNLHISQQLNYPDMYKIMTGFDPGNHEFSRNIFPRFQVPGHECLLQEFEDQT